MFDSALPTLALFLASFPLLFGTIFVRRWLRRRRKKAEAAADRCVCGYQTDHLDTIRCPECGRVSGFDLTAEQLGLTPEQLRQAKARRDARQAGRLRPDDAIKET